MIAREATWGEVNVDTYVRDLNGQLWYVATIVTGSSTTVLTKTVVRLRSPEGRVVTIDRPANDHPVTICEPTFDEGRRTIRDRLGGTPIAYRSAPGQPWRKP